MSTSIKLDADEKGKVVDAHQYRGMIGSLLYLIVSRPDIQFFVCMCVRYQSFPKEFHLIAVKRILRYLSGSTDLGLWYPTGCKIELISYSDADYVGCKLDRKSACGYCHFISGCLVSWSHAFHHFFYFL